MWKTILKYALGCCIEYKIFVIIRLRFNELTDLYPEIVKLINYGGNI